MKGKFRIKIQKGKITFQDKQTYSDWLNSKRTGDYDLTIEKCQDIRTMPQNKFYWAYITLIADETGEDVLILHELFKKRFLPPRVVMIRAVEWTLPPTTTLLSPEGFGEYMERICAWTQIPIPERA